jgi:hypothetical protein
VVAVVVAVAVVAVVAAVVVVGVGDEVDEALAVDLLVQENPSVPRTFATSVEVIARFSIRSSESMFIRRTWPLRL